MKIDRKAIAVWSGSGKEGRGKISTESGTMSQVPYATVNRFGDEKGTNPEELLAAAHASCFNMKLAFVLSGMEIVPTELNTEACLTLDKASGDWTVTEIKLITRGRVQGMTQEAFTAAAEDAKANCPISRALNASITLDAQLIEG